MSEIQFILTYLKNKLPSLLGIAGMSLIPDLVGIEAPELFQSMVGYYSKHEIYNLTSVKVKGIVDKGLLIVSLAEEE